MLNLHIGDSYALLEPYVPAEIEKLLTYWKKEITQDPRTYQNVVKGSVKKLYELGGTPNGSMQLVTLPGFVSLIKARLCACGYAFSIVDERPRRPEPDMHAALQGLRPYQEEGTHMLAHSRGGIIAAACGWGKTRIMAAMCRAWPQDALKSWGRSLTVVITPTVDIANKNFKDLREILTERDVGLLHGTSKKLSDDIQVVTPESMGGVAVEEAGLLIYDEVHTVTETRADQIGRAGMALRYGFSATPTGRFDGGDLLITGLFGPIVYSRTYAEAIVDGAVVPVKVFWVKLPRPDGWPDGGYSQRNAYYRHGVWRNADMHRAVAEITKQIPPEWQHLLLVDKIEHMNNLLGYLPGYTAVHAETSQSKLDENGFANVRALSGKTRADTYKKIAKGEIRKIISTGIYRQGVNFTELTVCVNCEGMGSAIMAGQIPGRASRNIEGKEFAYIIDFWHDWDIVLDGRNHEVPGSLLRDDKSREKVYRSLGFEQTWVDTPGAVNFQ